jgi:His-Xaa-Ser system radical SAM maturase HxsB
VAYQSIALPHASRALGDGRTVVVAKTGDHAVLTAEEFRCLGTDPGTLSIERQAALRSLHLLASSGPRDGGRRLEKSRIAARRETVLTGPSLHIIVPTLQCEHSCKYCQVSRSLDDESHVMSADDLDAACSTILQSRAAAITVEFQGGDPLLRFDLVTRAVERIEDLNRSKAKRLRFVVASTLHQLTAAMCEFLHEHDVYLSTSVDGPADLHNANRPTPSRDSYQRTVSGLNLARQSLGADAVSALMTATKASLSRPEDIVDEYVALGLSDIFVRSLSAYGFAKRNEAHLGYDLDAFRPFYEKCFERVLWWNRRGVALREVQASIILNKLLSPFDSGYVDLQSPTGAGLATLVYNYDGYVYPSDEARMLRETGDTSLRLGHIGAPIDALIDSAVVRSLVGASLTEFTPGCDSCAYSPFCAPNPVDAQAQFGTLTAPVHLTGHCQRHLCLFDFFVRRIDQADEWTLDLFHAWARPSAEGAEQ